MSGSNSSSPAVHAAPEPMEPLSFAVHSLPSPVQAEAELERRTARGRWKMLLVLAVCAAPVVASYLSYFVIRPEGRTNYSELIEPLRPIPADLALTDLRGNPVKPSSLQGQWLLVVVSGGACDGTCEHHLWIQRQLREALGRDKDRIDKLWLITDNTPARAQTVAAITTNTEATILRVPEAALAGWLSAAPGRPLSDHLYVVDPLGHWMMRTPVNPDPAKFKRDIEKLLRASAGWDKAGR